MPDQSLKVARKVTAHCFIDENGKVVFQRQIHGQRKPVALETIYDAISQCLHILDHITGEALDFYNRQPSTYNKIERGEMQAIFLEVQSMIASFGDVDMLEQNAGRINLGFDQIRQKLSTIKNRRKLLASDYLQSNERANKSQSLGEILAPVRAHLETIQRFNELDQIAHGVMAQARGLIDIVLASEKRLRHIYALIVVYEQQAHSWLDQIEKCQRETGVRCLPAHVQALRQIADDVSRPNINKVMNAFGGVALVEPYKSRIQSKEVQCLNHLMEYLELWESGKQELPLRFVNAFSRARVKLKRVVRTPQAQVDRQMLSQYQSAFGKTKGVAHGRQA